MESNILKGLKTRNPSDTDASTRLKGQSVDKDAKRSATAPSPRTLGPRTA